MRTFPDAILERERLYPSGPPMEGHKIAIPHTDAEHVNQSMILFARLAKPLEFASMGDPDEKISIQLISMFMPKAIYDILHEAVGALLSET